MRWTQTQLAAAEAEEDDDKRKMTTTSKRKKKLKERKMQQVVNEHEHHEDVAGVHLNDTFVKRLARTLTRQRRRSSRIVDEPQAKSITPSISCQLSSSNRVTNLHSSQAARELEWFVDPNSTTMPASTSRACNRAGASQCQDITSQEQAHCSPVRTDRNQPNQYKLTRQKQKHIQKKKQKQKHNQQTPAAVNLLAMRNILICFLNLLIALSIGGKFMLLDLHRMRGHRTRVAFNRATTSARRLALGNKTFSVWHCASGCASESRSLDSRDSSRLLSIVVVVVVLH